MPQDIRLKLEAVLHALILETLGIPADTPGYGPPCEELVSEALQFGLDAVAAEIISYGGRGEYRLNGAGLKLYSQVNLQTGKLELAIAGDQAEDYPTAVAKMRKVLRDRGVLQQ